MLGVLNARGEVAVVGRRGKQRVWDLAERWYPETRAGLAGRRRSADRRGEALPVARASGSSGAGSFAHPDADDGPVPAARTTFLSPFDRLIHDRDRAHKLWDFFYRLEMYVPKAKREYGYYVLPILQRRPRRRPHRAGARPQDGDAAACSARGGRASRSASTGPLKSLARWLGASL